MSEGDADRVRDALLARFGESPPVDASLAGIDELARMAGHRTHRRYTERAVGADLVRLLCACALSAPSKSDLQQADIMIVSDPAKRDVIADLLPDQPHVRDAPVFLVFLANGRRFHDLFARRDRPFVNDHLDAFFNSTVDAALVLASFLRAAEAVGLGCCPISVIRDHAATVSALLDLPERVIPVSGLCLGWPADTPPITPRLGLDLTIHENRYDDGEIAARIAASDRRRAGRMPYRRQRDEARWGTAPDYGWSEDKARQYATPQRADFGAFVRGKGFRLD
ncbi:MAG: NADPH-dependent oxidoreductase [Rhizobiales bacterium]|nr:NADPH-dependent oxidoreductase [Hyphomicrobiales bacterium]